MDKRFKSHDLIVFSREIFIKAGMPDYMANDVAEILVEGDLLGHSTHGLKLLPLYLKEIKTGNMTIAGDPILLADNQTAILMDGNYLPGPWLVKNAFNIGFTRLETNPIFAISIRRSHHIACLGAYLKKATDRGILCIIMSSDPNHRSVSPYGGYTPSYSPNPIAAGIPTNEDPVLIDISTSSTANGVVAGYKEENKKLPQRWLLNNKGEASDDPQDLFATPSGSLLPLGGLDLGYKGFALGILVEALTSALGGFGRSDNAPHWGASVFIQLIKPSAFSGLEYFSKETTFFADLCKKSDVIPGKPPVHMPGYSSLRKREEQIRHGVVLSKGIVKSLETCAVEYGISLPASI